MAASVNVSCRGDRYTSQRNISESGDRTQFYTDLLYAIKCIQQSTNSKLTEHVIACNEKGSTEMEVGDDEREAEPGDGEDDSSGDSGNEGDCCQD